jgi:hypothetical protein
MTTMTTGAAAVGTAAGSAIRRAIRKPPATAGKSVAGLDPGIAKTMTIAAIPAPAPATRRAGSPARDRVIAMTTTTDAAAAGTAVGSAIRRATRKHPVAAGRSEVERAHVLGPTTTMTGGHRARVIAMMTTTTGGVVAGMAAGTAIRKGIPRRHAAAVGSLH